MVMLTFACHKDKQNYIWKDINDLTVGAGATSYTRSINDSLIITPELIESKPQGDEIHYLWLFDDTLVSNKKDLRMKINKTIGSHSIRYTATNKKTGVQAVQRYTLTVRGAYYSGFYVAHNKAGKAEFSFIRADSTLFLNPFETINQKTYSGKAVSVNYISTSYTAPLVSFYTDNNVIRFNHDTFTETSDITTVNPTFADFPITGGDNLTIASFATMYILNGKVYNESGMQIPGSAAVGDYKLFNAIFTPRQNNPIYLYDNLGKRFLNYAALSGGSLVPAAATPTGSFDMANVIGRTMLAADGTGLAYNSEFYYLMTDNGGMNRYLMQNYSPGTLGQGVPIAGINQQMLNSPDIQLATVFSVRGPGLKQLYYAAGNKIYLYDIIANNARLVYTFPSGYVIKAMKRGLGNSPDNLVVAAYTGTAGEVYFFKLAPTGDFADNAPAKFTGFGEIAGIASRG